VTWHVNQCDLASIARDKMGNIALGYSLASTTMWDFVGVAGRMPTDPFDCGTIM
jgi:hypothetical protein